MKPKKMKSKPTCCLDEEKNIYQENYKTVVDNIDLTKSVINVMEKVETLRGNKEKKIYQESYKTVVDFIDHTKSIIDLLQGHDLQHLKQEIVMLQKKLESLRIISFN